MCEWQIRENLPKGCTETVEHLLDCCTWLSEPHSSELPLCMAEELDPEARPRRRRQLPVMKKER